MFPALVIGVVSSLHCMGMCGPIAIAAQVGSGPLIQRLSRGLLYHAGRIATYATLGVLVGLMGERLAMMGIQKWVSIGAGAVIIIAMLLPVAMRNRLDPTSVLGRYFMQLKSNFSGLMRSRNAAAPLGLGALNGLLPCGMVYVALTGALAEGSLFRSALFMVTFGLGTLPALMAVVLATDLITLEHRKFFSKIWPFAMMVLGALFILRGLELGIPYLSPETLAHAGGGAQCR